jgi:hypothetical protein
MGSIAMDGAGDIALGYSVSSASLYPSIGFTGRVPSDPLGMMQKETIIISGTGSQTVSVRWGDYTSMSIDPVDDCTFWYANEYLTQTGPPPVHTRIASFSFPTCTMRVTNTPPSCASAVAAPNKLWPPNKKMVPVSIGGVTDPDGDPVTISVTSVFQDEPLSSSGPNATLTPLAVLADRNGNDNGRVYTINFTAADGKGGTCTGGVTVCVPHDQGKRNTCINDGPLYSSLGNP